MKKVILTMSLALGVLSIHAQGLVTFANTGGSRVSTNSTANGAATGLVAAYPGQSFYYALFVSTTSSSVSGSTAAFVGTNGAYAYNAAGWSLGAMATNTGSAGRLASTTGDASSATAVNGVGLGGSAYFTLIGWSANIGSTVGELQNYLANPTFDGWVGQSAVSGLLTVGNGGGIPQLTLFGAAPNIPGFTLGLVNGGVVVVPEPTTLALAGLGGASLLLFRRRK